jgi:glycosyltransferase involved in cell wall biosynthesis
MRILFLQDHLRIGGTEKQTLALTRFGHKNGYETGLIVFRPGGAMKVEKNEPFFYKKLQPFNTRIDEWAPGLIGKILTFQPELIIFMGKVSHLYLPTIRKYLPSITLVATYRSGKPPLSYYRKALLLADGVITNSHAEHKRLIRPYGIPERLIKTVHNGCLISDGVKPKTVAKTAELRLLCSAMFRPQKNQLELLSILAQIPQNLAWHCTFAGTGKMLKPCKVKAKELGIEGKVTFTWSENCHELYKTHDVVVHTSNKESLPNCLVEAQCSGLPVVAYVVNGVGECFEDGVSGFGIPFGNQQAFRDALQLLGMNPEKRKAMSKAASAYGKKQFDFVARSSDFLAVAKEIHQARDSSIARSK